MTISMKIAAFNGREVLPRTPLHRTVTRTEDGTVIISDPEIGRSVSGRTLADAEAEVRRLKGRAAA